MRRLRYALAALVAALLLLVFVPHAQAADCHPLCAIYTNVWDPLYWWHSCYNCPPPSPEA
jgi:hypothetical protein